MNKVLVAPSILSGDFANLGLTVSNVCEWGADYVHVDVMDGSFVPNITLGMPLVKAMKKYANIPFDVHLMIVNPEKYVGAFVDAGADIVTFHPDATDDVLGALEIIKSKGAMCGLVLNPDKPLELILPYLDMLDMVVLMGVYAGFGGQSYIADTSIKIAELKQIIIDRKLDILIEMDGGATLENAGEIALAGVDVLVAGTAVFKANDPESVITKLRNSRG